MGFINNYKDNFLPSTNPWGDDNIVIYNTPSTKRGSHSRMSEPIEEVFDAGSLGYEQLKDMQIQLSSAISTLPQCPKKLRLRQKLMSIEAELFKREELESIARKDRDDNFEPKETLVKEDVEVAKAKPKPNLSIEPQLIDLDGDYEEDCYDLPTQQMGMGNMTGFLIASLIVIIALNMTKK